MICYFCWEVGVTCLRHLESKTSKLYSHHLPWSLFFLVTWEMSPSSMFSRGSRSPFVFWPSKISRSLQNQVTVLSCRTKYFVFQYHKLYLWFGLIATILLTKITVIVTWFLGFLWETSMNMELIIEWPNLYFSTFFTTIIVPITWRPRKRSCWWSQAEL